jgi:hypothetical protein
MRELAPWVIGRGRSAHVDAALSELKETRRWAYLFRFDDGSVQLVPKPDAVRDPGFAYRADLYLGLFRAAARMLAPGFAATICVSMDDRCETDEWPVFALQKRAGTQVLLLPDIDFLISDFYDKPEHEDPYAFAGKKPGAVFSGSTTGEIHTAASIRARSCERIRAAYFFRDSARVDFRLPGIAQCADTEAEALLAAEAFCQKPRLSWPEQFRYRFLLSLDGNGAACSRMMFALLSRCVLVKYASPHLLYYFGGLQPWVHFVPIHADAEVERVLEWAERDVRPFERIAEEGRRFALTYLTRDAVLRYTAALLTAYAERFSA